MSEHMAENLKGCEILEDALGKRIYLKSFQDKGSPHILQKLDSIAVSKNYTKIFAKISEEDVPLFIEEGYQKEAKIPGYFKGDKDCWFLGKFFSKERASCKNSELIKKVLALASQKEEAQAKGLSGQAILKKANQEDARDLSLLYQKVFPSYPFPIHDPQYIEKTMKTHIEYYMIEDSGNIVSASSAEKDMETKNVEMTDFATLPEYRKKGFASCLLNAMESALSTKGFRKAYTIARAVSFGMNMTFAKCGYEYGGTLINNTHISGNIESMNVWYKSLQKSS